MSISLRRVVGKTSVKVGVFRSYHDIGEWLVKHGETGDYWAIPKGIGSIAGMRKISVTRHRKRPDALEAEVEIDMEGSYY